VSPNIIKTHTTILILALFLLIGFCQIGLAAEIPTIMMLLCCTLPKAALDYMLGVFGNANQDDTINMQDVTFTELRAK